MGKKKNIAEKKEKDLKKLVKDKTFGMKNKNNSKKLDKLVTKIASQNKGGLGALQNEKYQIKKKQKQLEEEKKFLAEVFAGSVAAKAGEKKVGRGGKPICQFFKAGLCAKGKKCKFSHDMSSGYVAEKEDKVNTGTNKINLFRDQRDEMFGNEDNIDSWDQKKLEEAVNFNANKYESTSNQTAIVCKFFLTAVEKMRYGWFWKCPNGYNCKYKHCLPEGFKFENKKGGGEEVKKEDTELKLIEEIDNKRKQLDSKKVTPVTYEKFMAWVKKRREKKKKERDARIKEFMLAKGVKQRKTVTGRELFEKNQGLFKDAEGAAAKDDLNVAKENENQDEEKKDDVLEVDEDAFDDDDDDIPDL